MKSTQMPAKMQNIVKSILFIFLSLAITANADFISGDIHLDPVHSWWMCTSQTNYLTYIVNASSEALFTTSNFGAYIAGAGKPNSPCTGGVISQVLSSTDLQQFLDPTAVNYNVTLPYSSCSDCVQTCNQTKPQVPLDTWCLVVSNPNKVNGIYASVKIESSAPATTTTSSPTSTHNAGLRLSSQFQIPFLQVTVALFFSLACVAYWEFNAM